MKVMMVAGGTGGHIYPALALADILVRQDPSSEVVFFGSNDRLEAKIIPEKGYRFIGADMESTAVVLSVKSDLFCRCSMPNSLLLKYSGRKSRISVSDLEIIFPFL